MSMSNWKLSVTGPSVKEIYTSMVYVSVVVMRDVSIVNTNEESSNVIKPGKALPSD